MYLAGSRRLERPMLYFEDISTDNQYSAGPYLLTESEIVTFAEKWDPFDFHTDKKAAGDSVMGGLAAPGVLTLCIANRLCHDFGDWAIQAMMGSEYRLPAPAAANDEFTINRTVTSTRSSKSRPDTGIVQIQDFLVNQNGTTVLDQKGTLLMTKSP